MPEINNKDNFTYMVQAVVSSPQSAPQAQAPANQQVINSNNEVITLNFRKK